MSAKQLVPLKQNESDCFGRLFDEDDSECNSGNDGQPCVVRENCSKLVKIASGELPMASKKDSPKLVSEIDHVETEPDHKKRRKRRARKAKAPEVNPIVKIVSQAEALGFQIKRAADNVFISAEGERVIRIFGSDPKATTVELINLPPNFELPSNIEEKGERKIWNGKKLDKLLMAITTLAESLGVSA